MRVMRQECAQCGIRRKDKGRDRREDYMDRTGTVGAGIIAIAAT